MSTNKTKVFQAEVSQLLKLLAGALYKNKEVFMREIISNASDALDKIKFLSLENKKIADDVSDPKIVISTSKQSISITDNGIGMNEADLEASLGTIARSGTKEFLNKMNAEQAKNSDLIGQFGVGFYSAFVVADKVVVTTRKAGEEQGFCWTSNGVDSYTIEPMEVDSVGTKVEIFLKNDEQEFLEEWRIRQIVSRYADHIVVPIFLLKKVESEGEDKSEALEEVQINEAQALWSKSKSAIKQEQYEDLYKHIAHDTEPPLAWAHNKVEGKLSYTSLLYLPKNKPFDLWSKEHKSGLKLYVKRVFILDEAAQFLPMYLRFVKGVVDSADLPLNVSREMLQESALTKTIKTACTKRVLDLLSKMARDDQDKYQTFWDNFGAVLKEGAAEDQINQSKLLELFRFASTHTQDNKQTVALADYVKRMGDKQKTIYYCTADSYASCKNSPHLEVFRKNNIEVLLLSDRIDEWLTAHVSEFEKFKFQSVARGDIDFLKTEKDDDKESEAQPVENDKFATILPRMQKVLEDSVSAVKVSSRLVDSSACLVVDDNQMSTHLQRILKEAGQDVPSTKPVLEVNIDHPIVNALLSESSDEDFAAWVKVLFDQATLAEGGQLSNPAEYVKNIDKLLRRSA